MVNPDLRQTASLGATTGRLEIAAAHGDAPSSIRLSLVIPTYNESKNIPEVIRQLSALLDRTCGGAYEIIVVDDDSPDGTWALALELSKQYPALRVMRRQTERGLATAVIRGWQAARGNVLAVMDGDLQHPPEAISALWLEVEKGADIAVASRHVEGGGVSDWSLTRRIVSRAAQVLGLLILPNVVGRVSDPMSGYFMIRRSAIQGITMNPLGYKILVEILGRGKIRWIAEVPYLFRERTGGESKLTRAVYVDYLRHLLRLRISLLPLDRFLRFAVVGFSGVFVDMGMLFILSDPTMLGWGLTRSKLIGAEIAIVNNFYWNDRWTFGDVSSRQNRPAQRIRRFAKFQIVCLCGLALNAILLNVQFNLLGINRYIANAVAIAIVTGWNFWLNLKLSWRISGIKA